MEHKVYGMLGLAARKRSVVSGGDTCERALKYKSAGLLIIARDASENTKSRFLEFAAIKGVECRVFGECAELGKHIGKGIRSVLVVTDQQFAKSLILLIDGLFRKDGGVRIGKNQGL